MLILNDHIIFVRRAKSKRRARNETCDSVNARTVQDSNCPSKMCVSQLKTTSHPYCYWLWTFFISSQSIDLRIWKQHSQTPQSATTAELNRDASAVTWSREHVGQTRFRSECPAKLLHGAQVSKMGTKHVLLVVFSKNDVAYLSVLCVGMWMMVSGSGWGCCWLLTTLRVW